ncbi:hypothetical protein [Pseudomonas sp. NPDC086278]|uniref:hypothetical protein n=1 Tax=Pseudomonas sp. NPDC086278 TaxID=3390646 RepID=UPI003D07B16C
MTHDVGAGLLAKAIRAAIDSFDPLHHEAEFFYLWRHRQDVATSRNSGDPFMNINFAFACLIVVSFAIALGHG